MNLSQIEDLTNNGQQELIKKHFSQLYSIHSEFNEFELSINALLHEIKQIDGTWAFRLRVLPKLIEDCLQYWKKFTLINDKLQNFIQYLRNKYRMYSLCMDLEAKKEIPTLIPTLRQIFQSKFHFPVNKDENGNYESELESKYSHHELTGEMKFFHGRVRNALYSFRKYLELIEIPTGKIAFLKEMQFFLRCLSHKVYSSEKLAQNINAYITRHNLGELKESFIDFFTVSDWSVKKEEQYIGVSPVKTIIIPDHYPDLIQIFMLRANDADDLYYLTTGTDVDLKKQLGADYAELEEYLRKMKFQKIEIPMAYTTNLHLLYNDLDISDLELDQQIADLEADLEVKP